MIFVEEKWERFSWKVEQETVPQADENGAPRTDENGALVTMTRTVLVVFPPRDPATGNARAIRLPFGDDAKRELASKLTGGIVIPGVPHLPFGSGV